MGSYLKKCIYDFLKKIFIMFRIIIINIDGDNNNNINNNIFIYFYFTVTPLLCVIPWIIVRILHENEQLV